MSTGAGVCTRAYVHTGSHFKSSVSRVLFVIPRGKAFQNSSGPPRIFFVPPSPPHTLSSQVLM